MQSSSEKLPLIAADGPDLSSKLGKKRPLDTTTASASCSTGPLKKRWSTMATEAPVTTSDASVGPSRANATLQEKASNAGLNPLDLLSEISATASILERKGDPLAHYVPYTLNNVPEEGETARAALAAAPAHVQMKSQIIRRRQQLARLQNVCGYQNPLTSALGSTSIKMPSWQHIPGTKSPAAKVSTVVEKAPQAPAAPTAKTVVTTTTEADATTATAKTPPINCDSSTTTKRADKEARSNKKKVDTTKSKPKTSWKKKLAKAETERKSKTPTAAAAAAAAAAPKREYNYQPLGGRSYCWM